MATPGPRSLSDVRVHVKVKLSALWVSVMCCYIYGDFIGLYRPGKLKGLLAGRMPLGPITQGVLLGMAIVMAIPSVMVFLSLVGLLHLSRLRRGRADRVDRLACLELVQTGKAVLKSAGV